MPLDLAGSFLFLFYEVCIFLASVRIVYKVANHTGVEFSDLVLIVTWISTSLLLSSVIATILSFAGLNGAVMYVSIAGVLVGAVHVAKRNDLALYLRYVSDTTGHFVRNFSSLRLVIICLLFLPLLLTNMRPTDETDSLANMRFMFEWLFNKTTPYTFTGHYVATWELGYLPSLAITNSDSFLWLVSLKSVIVIGLAIYLVGLQIKLPKHLSWLVAISAISFFALWINPSGIGTTKNDMIVAAGTILIALAILQLMTKNPNRFSVLLLLFGLIFVLNKPYGLAIFFLSVIALIAFYRHRLFQRKAVLWAGLLALTILGTSGHYYIHNFITYGNPFYQFNVKVLGLTVFKGSNDLSDTSIMANRDDPRLWQYLLFSPSNFAKAGYIFPALLLFGMIGTAGVGVFSFYQFIRKKKADSTLIFLAFFILITWLIYLATPWSSGHALGDLVYVENVNSLRYVEGTLMLTELFLVYVLWRLGLPKILLFILITLNVGVRLLYLYFYPHLHISASLDYLSIFYPVTIILVALTLGLQRRNRTIEVIKIIVIVSFGISVFVVSPLIVEVNRAFWLPWWKNVISGVRHEQPSEVFLITDPSNWRIFAATYPLYGDKFQHTVSIVSVNDLGLYLADNSTNKPDFVAMLCEPNYNCKAEIDRLESIGSDYGYGIRTIDEHAILMEPFTEEMKLTSKIQELKSKLSEGDVPIDERIVLLEDYIALNPGNIDAINEYSGILLEHGEFDKARKVLLQVESMHQDSAVVQYRLAFSLAQTGNNEEAIAHYSKALELGFAEFWVRYNRGASYLALNEHDNACADLLIAEQLDPNHDGVKYYLGELEDCVNQ